MGAEVGALIKEVVEWTTRRCSASRSGIIVVKGGGNRDFDWDIDSNMARMVQVTTIEILAGPNVQAPER